MKTSRGRSLCLAALAASVIVSMIAGISIGSIDLSPAAALGALWNPQENTLTSIVWEVRTPRMLLAAIVGAGLAVAGAVMQAAVRNVLADPYLLGVHSGASIGAAAVILFGATAALAPLLAWAGDYALQAAAFLGAIAATGLVFSIARSGSSARLILAGVAVGYALSSATSFLIFASDSAESSRSVMFWLLGSLGLAAWSGTLAVTAAVTLVISVFLTLLGPRIDALASGDDTALGVGINPARFRTALVVVVSLLIGTIVAMSGAIAFIGLVVPHLARMMVGARHRWLIPAAALSGSTLLLWSDIASRTLLAPQEIPVGVITALIGAPFLLILIRKKNS